MQSHQSLVAQLHNPFVQVCGIKVAAPLAFTRRIMNLQKCRIKLRCFPS
ncbi:hypothetical protein HMPREF9543_04602 [Escherichia coli MS 146-1]|nr:hypothetical protein HMPREF9543_04602 [Escherichia coli MS 146-1]